MHSSETAARSPLGCVRAGEYGADLFDAAARHREKRERRAKEGRVYCRSGTGCVWYVRLGEPVPLCYANDDFCSSCAERRAAEAAKPQRRQRPPGPSRRFRHGQWSIWVPGLDAAMGNGWSSGMLAKELNAAWRRRHLPPEPYESLRNRIVRYRGSYARWPTTRCPEAWVWTIARILGVTKRDLLGDEVEG